MTLLEAVVKYVGIGASQEDMEDGDLEYAKRQVNAMSNFEFLETLSEVIQQPDSFFEKDV